MIETTLPGPDALRKLSEENLAAARDRLLRKVTRRFDDPSKREGWIVDVNKPGIEMDEHPFVFTRTAVGGTERFILAYTRGGPHEPQIELTWELFNQDDKKMQGDHWRVGGPGHGKTYIAHGKYNPDLERNEWVEEDTRDAITEAENALSNLP